jgi:hypothetical protein
MREVAATFTRVTGAPSEYQPMSIEGWAKSGPRDESGPRDDDA